VEQPLVEHLKHLIVDRLDVKLGPADIDERTPLFEGGMELDSFAIVELITLIEQSYGFEFCDGDLLPEHFLNLRAVADLVRQRTGDGMRDHAAR
jgi:acyl carrier protein